MLLVFYFGLLLPFVVGEGFKDYFKYDYCKLNCPLAKHSACKCRVTKPRKEVTTNPDTPEFRQKILDAHNKWRNHVATGKEERPEPGVVGPAANMMGMNYDLELEHIARCYGVNTYKKVDPKILGHDKCRPRYGNKSVGQNLHGKSAPETEGWERGWYNEVADVAAYIFDDYNSTYNKNGKPVKIGHFTQLVWWSADMVGCFRVHKPDNLRAWHFTVLCNYGSSFYRTAGNLLHNPIFKKGPPCSECPENTKCENKEYPGLCGKIHPAPKDKLKKLKGGAGFNGADKVVLAIVVAVIFLL